ncbi:MAG: metallophosphoesterase [Alphaproteobacteria bacterium]
MITKKAYPLTALNPQGHYRCLTIPLGDIFRFIQITDLHIFEQNVRPHYRRWHEEQNRKLLTVFLQHPDIDALIVTGDAIEWYHRDRRLHDNTLFLDMVREYMQGIISLAQNHAKQIHWLGGNHDDSEELMALFSALEQENPTVFFYHAAMLKIVPETKENDIAAYFFHGDLPLRQKNIYYREANDHSNGHGVNLLLLKDIKPAQNVINCLYAILRPAFQSLLTDRLINRQWRDMQGIMHAFLENAPEVFLPTKTGGVVEFFYGHTHAPGEAMTLPNCLNVKFNNAGTSTDCLKINPIHATISAAGIIHQSLYPKFSFR